MGVARVGDRQAGANAWCCSGQLERDVHDPGLPARSHMEPAPLEHFEHRGIFWQDLRDEFFQPGSAGNRCEMAHERRAETLALVFIDHAESDLGPSRLYDDVASAAHDRGPSVFLHDCDQGNVIDKVYVQEKRNFLLREASSYGKETAMEGFRAASADGLAESASVFGSEGTDFDAASVPQRLFRRESSCFRHGQQTPDGSYSRGRVRLTISTLPPIVQRETMTM